MTTRILFYRIGLNIDIHDWIRIVLSFVSQIRSHGSCFRPVWHLVTQIFKLLLCHVLYCLSSEPGDVVSLPEIVAVVVAVSYTHLTLPTSDLV